MTSLHQIQSLDLILTSACNLRCGYCFENDKKPGAMSWEIARKSIDRAIASSGEHVDIVFFGGEPTLEFPLLRRAVAYAEESKGPGKTVGFVLITNGTTLGAEDVAFLVEHDVETAISTDGVPEAQAFRGRDAFSAVDSLLRELRDQHPAFFRKRVSVMTTLFSRNIAFLAASVDYFLGMGLRRIDISPRTTHDPLWTTLSIEVLEEQFANVYRSSLAHFRRTAQVPVALFRRASGERHARPAAIGMCGVGSGAKLAVDVDGEASACVLFARSYQRFENPFLASRLEGLRMGDIRAPEFARRRRRLPSAARAAKIFDDKQDKYSSYGRCGDCRWLATCSVCPTSIGHIPGNIDPRRVPDLPCAFNLVALKYRARFPAVNSAAAARIRQRLVGRPTEARPLVEGGTS